MAREKTPQDEKFEKQDFDLFEALAAIDRKDYDWFSKLTDEQQKKFVPYMMIHWTSAVNDSAGMQEYFLRSVDYHANKYLFNESIQKNPKLQWLMLCAASPGLGSKKKFGYHQWIPHLSTKVANLKEPAKVKDVKEYFKKIYPKASENDIKEVAEVFVEEQKKKHKLAEMFPNLKLTDIETLSKVITNDDIEQYERESGN